MRRAGLHLLATLLKIVGRAVDHEEALSAARAERAVVTSSERATALTLERAVRLTSLYKRRLLRDRELVLSLAKLS